MNKALNERVKALFDLVNEQAEDEGLWFQSASIHEAFLQQELRKLHDAVEHVMDWAKENS